MSTYLDQEYETYEGNEDEECHEDSHVEILVRLRFLRQNEKEQANSN